MHSSSKMTGMVLYFALLYMISVHSLLSVLTGSSVLCQLEGMTVMTKDSHPQRQITRVSRIPAILPARKNGTHSY